MGAESASGVGIEITVAGAAANAAEEGSVGTGSGATWRRIRWAERLTGRLRTASVSSSSGSRSLPPASQAAVMTAVGMGAITARGTTYFFERTMDSVTPSTRRDL